MIQEIKNEDMFKDNEGQVIIHCHTDNSIKDSPMKIPDMVQRAKEMHASAITLTDHGTCTGWIEFRNTCAANGIKGILGVEGYVKTPFAEHAHILLLAMNYQGLQEISEAVSEGNANLQNIGGIMSPVFTMEMLQKYFSNGNVIATSACVGGILASILLSNETFEQNIKKLKKRLAKYENPESPAYTNNKAKLDSIIAQISAIREEKKEATKWSKKEFTDEKRNRIKGSGESLQRRLQEFDDNKKRAEEARALLPELEEKLEELLEEKSTLQRICKQMSSTHEKYKTVKAQIDELAGKIIPPEERIKKTEEMAMWFKALLGQNFYIELQYHGLPAEKKVMPVLAEMAKKLNIPVVVANDAHIVTKDQAEARQFMKALRFERWSPSSKSDEELYLKTDYELAKALKMILPEHIVAEAIANTRFIGSQCNVEIPDTPHYPVYIPSDPSDKRDSPTILRETAYSNIPKLFAPGEFNETYQKRLEYELSVIIELGYADYLLIVADFINFGKEYSRSLHHGRVGYGIGPGRGSACGSLTTYLLGITSLDPLKYGLIFERFLNKARQSMPDIDTDFSSEVRSAAIEYVKKKYGKESVACIRTSITQGAKGSIKNSARIRGYEKYGPKPSAVKNMDDEDAERYNYSDWEDNMRAMRGVGDTLAKVIPEKPDIRIDDALNEVYAALPTNPDAKVILDRARMVEGTITGTSIHAAGIIIGDGTPLKEIIPLMYNTNKEQWAVQCDMVEAEHDLKLLKMDFLGLNNLDIITECARRIYEETGKKYDLDHLPFEEEVFREIYAKGNTNSIFQFESDGMKKMLREFRPTCFEDIILLVAAYRPGPMEFIPAVISAKHHLTEPKYVVEELRDILAPTYGQPIYQEQLMDIFHKCAGFSLEEADNIRRYMSKKKVDKFLAYKPAFIQGIINLGASQEDAEGLWDSLTGFAKYGFNKAHAAAYAYVSYITAFLKYHYPEEYMCAVMNNSEVKKIPGLLKECRSMNITIRPPQVNTSMFDFSVAVIAQDDASADTPYRKEIVYGLNSIKNFDKESARSIIANRSSKYVSIDDFIVRTGIRQSSLELLIKCGAFDDLYPSRKALLEILPKCIELIGKVGQKEKIMADAIKQAEEVKAELQPYIETLNSLRQRKDELTAYINNAPDEQRQNLNQQLAQCDADIEKYEKAYNKIDKKRSRQKDRYMRAKSDRDFYQSSLTHIEIPDIEDSYDERLDEEYALLGAFISGHPVDIYRHLYFNARLNIQTISNFTTKHASYMGVISNLRVAHRKSDGAPMAFFDLEDHAGTVHVCCFTKAYSEHQDKLKDGAIVIVSGSGKYENDAGEERKEVYANKIEYPRRKIDYIGVWFNDGTSVDVQHKVSQIFSEHQTDTPAIGVGIMCRCSDRDPHGGLTFQELIPELQPYIPVRDRVLLSREGLRELEEMRRNKEIVIYQPNYEVVKTYGHL